MLNFVSIILIVFEIAITIFIILKIEKLNTKIIETNANITKKSENIPKTIKEVRESLIRLNKALLVFTDKKYQKIKKIIALLLQFIKITVLLKSLKLKGECKFL